MNQRSSRKGNPETAVRLLLALMVAVFGINKFLHFMPMPEPPPAGGEYLGALTDSGIIFPVIGVVFLLAALCLLTRRVLFALVLLAPVAVNILLYHLKFDPAGIGAGVVLTLLLLLLTIMHLPDVRRLFAANR